MLRRSSLQKPLRLRQDHSEQTSLPQRWLRRTGQALLLGGTALVAVPAEAVQLISPLPEGSVAVASDDPALDSVLVETREGEPLGENEAAGLEPISEIAEVEPELAEPLAEGLPPTAAVEASDATPRVATRSQVSDQEDVAAAYEKAGKLSPARFRGVTPGVSTRDELVSLWGEPAQIGTADGDTTGGEVLGYELEPFESVEALVEGGVVAVVRVTLAEDTTVDELTTRLKLTEIDPVEVNDPRTNERLAAVFPEKGLTLLIKPTSLSGVSHLVLEPISTRAFVLRAEQRPATEIKAKLADLKMAISATPTDAHAHWLAAEQQLAAGQAGPAEASAAEAVRLAATDPAYRLTLAEALLATAEYDKAVLETRRVLDDASSPEVVRAGALDLMGRLAAMGDSQITAKTIDFHNAAIEIADRLATSTDDTERRLAKDVLLSAHLAVAKEIARRDYTDKAETVAEWIGRASGLAEERISSDDGGLGLRLRVAHGALAALAELRPTKDPGPWLKEAEETAETLLAEVTDPLFRARVHWELGQAYQHAVRIEHLRGDATQALGYGTQAIQELSAGAEPRATSPAAEQLVGQLYFYLGAANAVHRQDHTEAVGWYDKAQMILTMEGQPSEFVIPRRDGEELVSMGVSYWQDDQKDLAVELTEAGARMMERGVAAGVVKEKQLAVPYGNLETMYKSLGNTTKVSEYGRLVRGVRGVPKAEKKAPLERVESAAVAQQSQAKANPPARRQTQQQASRQTAPAEQATPKVSLRGRGAKKRWQR